LIDNPISKAPGFSLENVHVMAGIPRIFQVMLDGLLPRLTGGAPLLSETVRIDQPEGALAAPLGAIAAGYPEVSIGSYPFTRDGRFGSNVVLRASDPALLAAAKEAVVEMSGTFS
ncbi:MAG: competence/damage-inducible protein A, partial [Pseudomonadota bacterium]